MPCGLTASHSGWALPHAYPFCTDFSVWCAWADRYLLFGSAGWSFQGADLLALESPRTTDLILLLSLEHAGGGSVSFVFSLSRNVCRLRSSAFRNHRASLAEAHMCRGSGGNALASSGFLLCRHQVGTPGTLMFQPHPERLRGMAPAEPSAPGLTCASRCPDASFLCIL